MLPNNDIIFTVSERIPPLQCISGSLQQGVGQWIQPDGQNDLFKIMYGPANDPGYIEISIASEQSLSFSDQGVYTCSIPDYAGEEVLVHVGLYYPAPLRKLF